MGTVLIVDDEPDILYVLELILTERGYRVVKASNGQHGLEQALSVLPDLVLCDWMMPIMDGVGLFWALKRAPKLQAIPVVFMSAAQPPGEVLGAGFLRKPFDMPDLFAVLEQYVRR
jgi:CheY-like chemotaxis protein